MTQDVEAVGYVRRVHGHSPRVAFGVNRAAWMASHACWVAALAISVTTGRRYATDSLGEFGGIGGLCDDAFANGNNGPFGYGQNSSAEDAINRLLVGGACVAAGLALWSLRLRARRLAVFNLVLGGIGGTIARMSVFGQHESNPYCSAGGWRGVTAVAAVLLVLAGAVNLSSGRPTSDGPPTTNPGSQVTPP